MGSQLRALRASLFSNQATRGGAIGSNGAPLNIDASRFGANSAAEGAALWGVGVDGGLIANTLWLDSVSQSRAGGVVWLRALCELALQHNSFARAKPVATAAIVAPSGALTVQNSIFVDHAGGVDATEGVRLTADHNLFTGPLAITTSPWAGPRSTPVRRALSGAMPTGSGGASGRRPTSASSRRGRATRSRQGRATRIASALSGLVASCCALSSSRAGVSALSQVPPARAYLK